MEPNEERKRRTIAWEQKHGKKLEDCSQEELIEAAQSILALTRLEAEDYLGYILSLKAGNL